MSCFISEQLLVADNIKRLIKSEKLTQRYVASAIDMSPQLLSSKLRCIKRFTLRDVARIADVFDVSVDYLLGRDAQGGA